MSKISELSDGGSLLPTDFLIAVRSGGNVKVQADQTEFDRIRLGDNEKIELGNSQDLQIFHDGTDSYIDEQGTGTLNIRSSTTLRLQNAAGGNYLYGTVGGEVVLYYDGGSRLATSSSGVDVIGSVTADGLTVDGGSVNNDSSAVAGKFNANGNEHIRLEISTDSTIGNQAGLDLISNSITSRLSTTGSGGLVTSVNGSSRMAIATNGDISFYDTAGTSQALFWDASAESLGIGTTSPAALIHGMSGDLFLTANSTAANSGQGVFFQSTTSGWATSAAHAAIYGKRTDASNGYLRFDTRQSGTTQEAMRIDSSGNVKLITANDTAGTSKFLTFGTNSFNRAGIKCTNAATYDGSLEFYTGNATNFAERMRIDSSGNFLVGKTATTFGTAGIALRGTVADFTRDGGTPINVNRLTSDGSLIDLHQDGTLIGSLGASGGSTYIGGYQNAGLYLNGTSDVRPWNTSTQASLDASIDLGTSSARFKDLYLSDTAHASTYRLKNGTTTTGGLFHEKDLVGSGSSYDTSLFAETGNAIHFMVNGSATPVGTFDTSGNLLVGKTSASSALHGGEIRATGQVVAAVDGSWAGLFNRETDDGEILRFKKDDVTVGSIGTEGSDLSIGNGDAGLQFIDGTQSVRPFNVTTNARIDAQLDLGMASTRFKDLYLSGGAYLGGTAAANLLDDVESGNWTPVFNNFSATGTTTNAGLYFKVGRLVYVELNLDLSSPSYTGGGSGTYITGLPFSISGQFVASLGASNLLSTATFIDNNGGGANLFFKNSQFTTAGIGSVSFMNNSGRLRFSATYYSTA